MPQDTVFSLAHISAEQGIAFFGFAIFAIGFFVWVARLARKKTRRNRGGRPALLRGMRLGQLGRNDP